MSRAAVIAAGLQVIVAELTATEGDLSTQLGIAYDAGVTDTNLAPVPSTFTLAQLDAAVAAQAAQDATAQASALAALQTQFNAELASLQLAEEQAVKNALDSAIQALLNPSGSTSTTQAPSSPSTLPSGAGSVASSTKS